MNASGTMIRRACELDVGSKIVVGGAIRTVTRVIDLVQAHGVFISMTLDNGCVIIERAGTFYTQVQS